MLNKRSLRLGANPDLNPPISREARARIAKECSHVTLALSKRRVPYEAYGAAAKIRMAVVDGLTAEQRKVVHEHGLKAGHRMIFSNPLVSSYKKLKRLKKFREDFALAFRYGVIFFH